MNTLREEIEKIIKRDTYAIICSNCSGGGYDYDNQKECEDCSGTGLSEWRLDLPVENILSLIENEKAKQREDLQQDIRSVYHQLKGSTERFKISNYVEKYLLETEEKESK